MVTPQELLERIEASESNEQSLDTLSPKDTVTAIDTTKAVKSTEVSKHSDTTEKQQEQLKTEVNTLKAEKSKLQQEINKLSVDKFESKLALTLEQTEKAREQYKKAIGSFKQLLTKKELDILENEEISWASMESGKVFKNYKDLLKFGTINDMIDWFNVLFIKLYKGKNQENKYKRFVKDAENNVLNLTKQNTELKSKIWNIEKELEKYLDLQAKLTAKEKELVNAEQSLSFLVLFNKFRWLQQRWSNKFEIWKSYDSIVNRISAWYVEDEKRWSWADVTGFAFDWEQLKLTRNDDGSLVVYFVDKSGKNEKLWWMSVKWGKYRFNEYLEDWIKRMERIYKDLDSKIK